AYVISQLPRIEDNDRVLKVLCQAEDDLKLELIALVEQWDDADAEEVAATQRTLDEIRANQQERRQALPEQVQRIDCRPVEPGARLDPATARERVPAALERRPARDADQSAPHPLPRDDSAPVAPEDSPETSDVLPATDSLADA